MEQQTEQTEQQKRIIKPTDRPKILVLLDTSIKLGKESDFTYTAMSEDHRQLKRIVSLGNMIDKKKDIFNKLDENSFMFQRILDTAKLALRKIQDDGEFNYYSAELIMKFLKLEEVFLEKNLKAKEVRFIEPEQSVAKKSFEVKGKEQRVASEIQGNEEFVREGVSGARLESIRNKKEQEKELSKALEDFDFDEVVDEEITEEDLESNEIDGDESEQNDALNELDF